MVATVERFAFGSTTQWKVQPPRTASRARATPRFPELDSTMTAPAGEPVQTYERGVPGLETHK
jgi:hypothetical protein